MLPSAVGLQGILLLDRGDNERGDFGVFGIVCIHWHCFLQVATTTGFDGEVIGPLAFDGVKDVSFFPGRIEGCGEGIFLARDPAFAGVVYFRDKSGGGGDVGAIVELDERFAVNKAFDVEGGEGDEVGFVIGSYGKEGVADLFDVDCAREGGFLSIITLELKVTHRQ